MALTHGRVEALADEALKIPEVERDGGIQFDDDILNLAYEIESLASILARSVDSIEDSEDAMRVSWSYDSLARMVKGLSARLGEIGMYGAEVEKVPAHVAGLMAHK